MTELYTPTRPNQTMDRDSLAQAILNLDNGLVEPVEDPQLAYQLGHHVKPVIDQLTSAGESDEPGISSLDPEAALSDSEDRVVRRSRPIKKMPSADGPMPELDELSVEDKARWILMERFISLDQHEAILDCTFSPEDRKAHLQDLDQLLETLFRLPQVAKPLAAANMASVHKIFASTLLVFRNTQIGGNTQLSCNLENLRHTFPDYFYKRRKTPNWFEAQDFYTEPIARPHWALCGFEFLNCTLSPPRSQISWFCQALVFARPLCAAKIRRRRYLRPHPMWRGLGRTPLRTQLQRLHIHPLQTPQPRSSAPGLHRPERPEDRHSRQSRPAPLDFISFGENGIRIGDLSRQQVHPQLGVCPSW